MDDIRRGEIFYIARGGATNGSEQFADRPAVVVSNDENNKHSGVIEVVYMTTQPKTDLPTHVTVLTVERWRKDIKAVQRDDSETAGGN